MVEVNRYVRFYAPSVSLVGHGLGGLQLSIVLWYIIGGAFRQVEPKRDRITGFGPVMAAISVEKNTLAVSLSSSY